MANRVLMICPKVALANHAPELAKVRMVEEIKDFPAEFNDHGKISVVKAGSDDYIATQTALPGKERLPQ